MPRPEYEQRLNQIPAPRLTNPDGSFSTHSMAAEVDGRGNWFAFPTVQPDAAGQLMRYGLRDAQARAMATGNFKAFGADKAAALAYANQGYKKGTALDQLVPESLVSILSRYGK